MRHPDTLAVGLPIGGRHRWPDRLEGPGPEPENAQSGGRPKAGVASGRPRLRSSGSVDRVVATMPDGGVRRGTIADDDVPTWPSIENPVDGVFVTAVTG